MPGEPAAFMSYVRFNDQHDDGQLTQFRQRLSAEVRVQTGEEFPIFQDRNDIAWGQAWQQRIDETLDAVTLLLVIITPSFFRSPACRKEVERFLHRERELGRQDLILPVYYVSTPEMDDPERRDADELARVLASRQFADWRELRFEPFTSPVVRKAIARLASRMRDTFWRSHGDPSPRFRETMPSGTPQSRPDVSPRSGSPTVKAEPPTHIVDPDKQGGFVTVGAAIAKAHPGDRILVRPGLYQESLVIDKPLEILGDGDVNVIKVMAVDAHAVLFRTNIGRIANLTLRQNGSEFAAVKITQGRLELEACDINSETAECVSVSDGADPALRRNTIHGAENSGVLFTHEALGTLEDNNIVDNGLHGISVGRGSNPTMRRNYISKNKQCGILFRHEAQGTLEDNEISENERSGVEIRDRSNPTLRRNFIRDGKANGILCDYDGLGTLEDNTINGNAGSGIIVRRGAAPTLRRNWIYGNELYAVWVYDRGGGHFEDNDLAGNLLDSWKIAKDSQGNVTRRGNRLSRRQR